MAEVFDAKRASWVIAVEEVPLEETSHYGIVEPEAGAADVFRIVNLVNPATAGRYIFSLVIFDMIGRVQPDKHGEIQLTDAIQLLCEKGRRVMAVRLTPQESDTTSATSRVTSKVSWNSRWPTRYTAPTSAGCRNACWRSAP